MKWVTTCHLYRWVPLQNRLWNSCCVGHGKIGFTKLNFKLGSLFSRGLVKHNLYCQRACNHGNRGCSSWILHLKGIPQIIESTKPRQSRITNLFGISTESSECAVFRNGNEPHFQCSPYFGIRFLFRWRQCRQFRNKSTFTFRWRCVPRSRCNQSTR